MKTNKKGLTFFFSLIIGLSLVSIGITSSTSPQEINRETEPFIGFFAPDFTLQELDREIFNLSDFEGKPVVLFFWASWCSVCKSIIPDLQSIYLEYSRDEVEIISINLTYQDQLPTVEAYRNDNLITFPVLLDTTGKVSDIYKIHALPTTFIITPEGKIHSIVVGNGATSAYIASQLKEMEP